MHPQGSGNQSVSPIQLRPSLTNAHPLNTAACCDKAPTVSLEDNSLLSSLGVIVVVLVTGKSPYLLRFNMPPILFLGGQWKPRYRRQLWFIRSLMGVSNSRHE